MTLRIAAVMVVLSLSAGCAARHGQAIVGGTTTLEQTGTVSGTVRTAQGAFLNGRRVSAVDVASAAHFDVTTGGNGGYTIKVPTGTYRLEVELRGGEVLGTQPPQTQVNVGDLDAQLDFVVGR